MSRRRFLFAAIGGCAMAVGVTSLATGTPVPSEWGGFLAAWTIGVSAPLLGLALWLLAGAVERCR
jgi:hypothetical protein